MTTSRSRREALSPTEERLSMVHVRLAAVLGALALTLARKKLQPGAEARWAGELTALAAVLKPVRENDDHE